MNVKPEFRRIAVVGAGMMGHGIALSFARGEYDVAMIDVNDQAIAKGMEWIESDLEVLVDLGLMESGTTSDVISRITGYTDLEAGVRDADFVTEAVPDDLEAKRDVFRALEKYCSDRAVFATTTATFRVGDIASALEHKERMIGAHWVNPPHVMPLVEVASSEETSPENVEAAMALFRRIGKKPIRCSDIPGYINNRLLFALLNEGLKILEMGAATPEDIDNAVRYGFGVRAFLYGPFRWMDFFGNLRQTQIAYESLYATTRDETFRPSMQLRQQIEAGSLGFGTGKGWYEYPGGSPDALVAKRARMLTELVECMKGRELLLGVPGSVNPIQ